MNLQRATIYAHAAFYRESLSPLTSTRQPQPDPGLRADAQTTRACWQSLERFRLVCFEAQRRSFLKERHAPTVRIPFWSTSGSPSCATGPCRITMRRSTSGVTSTVTLLRYIARRGILRPLHHRTRRGAAGVTFQLPDGRHVGPPSVPVRYPL